jgi:PAS domain S-box-containing protein
MPTILRYGIAVLSVAIAIGLDFFVLRQFEAILTPFLFAVAATVWYAGTGPGGLAIVLSVLSLNYFFLPPVFSFRTISYADFVYLAFCTFCALAVGWVSAVRRRAEQELRQARDELEAKVSERTASLQRSESYLAETQNLTHTGTWAWDARSQKVLFCSEEMFRIYGLDPQVDLPIRRNFRQRVHPEDRSRVDERQARVFNEKVGSFDEFRIVLPDGTAKHVSSLWHPVLDGNGELVELIGTAADITERKRAEEALRESERRARSAFDGIAGLVAIVTPNGEIETVNRQCIEYFGRPVEEQRDWVTTDMVHPEDLPDMLEKFKRAIASEIPYHFEQRLRRFDGEYRWFETRGGAVRDDTGRVVRWYVLLTDIEDRKRAEQALRERERSLRLAIDGIDGLVGVLAPNGELEAANRRLFEYFGRSLEELKNWGTNDTVHPEDLPRILDLVMRGVASEIPFNFELRVRRFDGEYRWFENRHVPILDDSGRIARWYLLLTDIEDRTRALARLDQLQSDFAHMNRVATMGQLTASITHEVNQPITAAVTYALAARRFLSADPPNFREVGDALSLIVKEGNRAGEVVERVRALVKKVPTRKDAVEIHDAILEVIALTRTEAANNSVSVRTQFAEGLPRVQGDRVQLQQVALNLIVNAIQAMRGIGEGARELQISIDAVPSEGGVRVGVRDTGPGLSPESLSRLFEPFYTTKPDGMGMGLSICRSIIEAHGGRLWAIPCEPQGALFQFTIPATRADGS